MTDESITERLDRLEETLRKVAFLQGELALVIANMRREIAHLQPGGNPMNIGTVAILREAEISQILRDALLHANTLDDPK